MVKKTDFVRTRTLAGLACFAAMLAPACAGSDLRGAGAPPAPYVVGPRGEPAGAELGHMRFAPGLCPRGDGGAAGAPLDVDDFVKFLRAQGAEPAVAPQRGDLTIVEASMGAARPVRFRVAVLPTSGAAGEELHKALLEHGPGAWGLRRSNLAVLVASPSSVDDIVAFAAKTKLACWGALNVTAHDDVYVVPGGHFEL